MAKGNRTHASGLTGMLATLPGRAGAAGQLAGGVAARLAEAARQLPGADRAEARFRQVEQRVLRELKQRLDAAGDAPDAGRRDDGMSGPSAVSRTFVIPLLQQPRRVLEELLERSQAQTREQALDDFYSVLLSELVPDEARILALLSDGAPQAILHVGVGAPIGPVRRLVAENFAGFGRAAQVKLLEHLPLYIEHLKALRLVEEQSEVPALDVKYQILEGLREVRDVMEHTRRQTRQSVRVLRRALRISPLGEQLWRACVEPEATVHTGFRLTDGQSDN
jgi:hypothetical protein